MMFLTAAECMVTRAWLHQCLRLMLVWHDVGYRGIIYL